MNKTDDINDYFPSILNPRSVKKRFGDLTLTQNSVVSRCSLSLKRKNRLTQVTKSLQKIFRRTEKENVHNNNSLVQHNTLCAVPRVRTVEERSLISAVEEFNHVLDKENSQNSQNQQPTTKKVPKEKENPTLVEDIDLVECSIGLSAVEDLNATVRNNNTKSSPFSFEDIDVPVNNKRIENINHSLITVSSATELINDTLENSQSTTDYDLKEERTISVSFGVNKCETIRVSTKNSSIKKIDVTHKDNATNVDCELIESSIISLESETDENMNEVSPSPPKKLAIAVNLEIKKKKPSEDAIENSKVLILNTDDIERLSHVIVQPPNYKLVKRQILNRSKFDNSVIKRKPVGNGKCVRGEKLKQKRIEGYLCKSCDVIRVSDKTFVGSVRTENVACNDGQDMNKNLGVADAVKCDHTKAGLKVRKDNESPRSIRVVQKREAHSPRQRQSIRPSNSEAQRVSSSKARNDSASSQSPRKNINVESVQFNLPSKSQSIKNPVSPRSIPHYKIVAGTHFAVDAFSYGEIPNVKHYFLTHFHSDHYSGLKKTFSKFLFCSKITADLCITRLGVNPKCIHIMNCDEHMTVDGIEVTAVDANHCPGAIMLVFTLPNGKTLLHTGDFRASPLMESFPVFWNKDINTVYLDTTYCNPRYDFPTQEQSLEMALYVLRQKKLALEKLGKKFSSVLIVCGTYTIGKEKFFLSMARRVGCSVWACPEKDRVLQAVEGRSFSHAPPHTCQLHVVPMRDLTHEKLRSYLDSLQGAFSEVVAFKPSGWENGKNSAVEKDNVTIHGIPYSEHSSFSELIRFVKFLKPKQVVPTVDISGGVKSVQKYFPCPLVCKEETGHNQSKVTDYFSIQGRQQVPAIT